MGGERARDERADSIALAATSGVLSRPRRDLQKARPRRAASTEQSGEGTGSGVRRHSDAELRRLIRLLLRLGGKLNPSVGDSNRVIGGDCGANGWPIPLMLNDLYRHFVPIPEWLMTAPPHGNAGQPTATYRNQPVVDCAIYLRKRFSKAARASRGLEVDVSRSIVVRMT